VSVQGLARVLTTVTFAVALLHAAPAHAQETRAALDPRLVEGRGADVNFAEQEAENADHTGELLSASATGDIASYDPDRRGEEQRAAYTLSAEASGRDAVRLDRGDYVEFTLTRAANAITVRYSIPDAAQGGGIRSPLRVTVDGRHAQEMTLTSEYAWLYADYPFSNDPNSDWLHPDWWRPPTETQEKPHRPNHFYDEQRLLLRKTYRAGDTVRLTVPSGARADWTVIDLLDSERVANPRPKPPHAVSITWFGADASGRRDSSAAFDAAIAYAKRRARRHAVVYIPKGTFKGHAAHRGRRRGGRGRRQLALDRDRAGDPPGQPGARSGVPLL
jgi:hypothetical protein